MIRSLVASLALVALVATTGPLAYAERKTKSAPVTRADVDRIERRLEDQQKVLDRLVKLQQQYMQSLSAIFDAPVSASATPPPEPKDEPKAAPEPKAEPRAAIEVKPAKFIDKTPKVAAKKEGPGTIVGKVTGAADAVVYIEDIVAPARPGTATMKQEGKQFVPSLLVVQKGTTVQFPNMDAVFHNVFSVSPDNSFDLGSYRQGDSKSIAMARSGVISVYCNMHPQMVGHILVVPNGNYVRAGKDGFFKLQNVPPGRHRVVAWAPNGKPAVGEAEVADGQVVSLELEVKRTRAAPHMKKDGLPYGSYEQ